MKPTRHDWPWFIGVLAGLFMALSAAIDREWALTWWAVLSSGWALSGYVERKNSAGWKTLYLAAKARADRAQWGGHLS